MKWIRNYNLFKESKQYSNKGLITEMCVSMVLINNEFLDSILDRGLKARYSENSQIFLTDLKNLLIAKNRLKLGKFTENRCVEDDDMSKINSLFESIEFDIEKDWNLLINARQIARNIIDKVLINDKLTPDKILNIFWLGPNKTDEYKEDIVIELQNNEQYSIFLTKALSSQKSASFNTFADDLIGEDLDKLYKDEYLSKWDKLVQEWIRLIYENANKNIQMHIEKFIDPKRIDSIGYFDYFDIRHGDPKFKYLGEFIKEFNKNILRFSDLMTEIWKKREEFFMDHDMLFQQWTETKIIILNSRILENLFTTSLKTKFQSDIQKVDDNFKKAEGTVKMKLFKTIIEKLGCLERPLYHLGNNGNTFNMLPERDFFRKHYDDISIKFDYHVKFKVSEDEDNNDFKVRVIMEMDDSKLLEMTIVIKFTSEMSGKLNAKYKFDIPSNFNFLIDGKRNPKEEY